MPAQDVRLGPFVQGLNTFSDPTAIGDTEVCVLQNLENDIDGSLVNRPPLEQIGATLPGSDTFGINVLGFYEGDAGVKYLVASNRNNATYYFDGAAWVLITNTFAASALAQYRAELWLVAPPSSGNPGGKWTPSGGFIADANMPKGGCAVAFKDRVWIGPGVTATSNGARLYLSSIVSGLVNWPAVPNFLNIGAGDGQNIVDLGIYYDSLLIFKQGSTYRYTFSGDPSLGVISRVSDNIGAIAKGCFAGYKNEIYVLFDNKVYLFSNFNYDELNIKVPLVANNPAANLAEQSSISVWSDRVFVQFYDVTYVYSLTTRTWSVWQSNLVDFMGRFWAIPGQQGTTPTAYTYRTAKTGFLGLFRCVDAISTTAETMTCRVVTKNYDYQESNKFKRLISWGVDVISKVAITSKVVPVTYTTAVTWDQLKNAGLTWDNRKAGGYTWDRPLDFSVVITDPVVTGGSGSGRKYIKFLKSVRFRQVGFDITAITNGDTATAPLRIFNIMTRVSVKETVSKKIS
jgi:hypothetical protein